MRNNNLILYSAILILNINITLAKADTENWWIEGKFYESVKDNFLVATLEMTDPRFKNSVIVMLENDKNGALGLAINKPVGKIPLGKLINLSEHSEVKKKDLLNVNIPIYWGGPVGQKIIIIHSKDYKNENTTKYDGFFITSDYKTLFKIAENKGPKKKLVIIGVSSWGKGQLEGEMERDDWMLSEIEENIIFDKDNEKKWKIAISKGFRRL